jgi:hypothetical protein
MERLKEATLNFYQRTIKLKYFPTEKELKERFKF